MVTFRQYFFITLKLYSRFKYFTVVMMRIFLSYKKLFKVPIVDKNHRRLEQVPPQAKQVDDHARKVHAQQLILARPGNAKLGIPPSSSKSLSCPILPSSSKSCPSPA
ncbi:unnamed protein product [Arabidopsis lyrata]|uniref:Predicted protein n=1 Tax=Arabidopsis lyrata subsp. lyrata TaxID=81972 RepID=D7LB16_ARALL|nr:predicted protein [Arabidopsis lyrata subsp. lyrata]CAH8261202.1 unnamed protein product [Arabidopsis lyrata]